tara:strand:- start:201 stop:458 length:258 start_codon:yes stop_codon:yes gene_type:complete
MKNARIYFFSLLAMVAFTTVSCREQTDETSRSEALIEEMEAEGAEIKKKVDGDETKIKLKTKEKKVKIKKEDGETKFKVKTDSDS